MKPFWYWFCWVLMFTLDRIPRYGRLYIMKRPVGVTTMEQLRKIQTVKVWEWQRRGLWGFHLVRKMGMMWPFFQEAQWRRDEKNRRSAS
jgi:hypothetical protein